MRGRSWHRMRVFAAGLVLLMLLSACGPLPRPFGRDDTDVPNPLADNLFREGVEVEPLTGTTRPMGQLLAEAVAKNLEREHEIPAATALNQSRFILTGHVHINENYPTARTLVSIGWQLDERDGETVDAFVQDIPATRLDSDYGAASILARVGLTTGTRVARMIFGDSDDVRTRDRLLGRRGIFVREATGAPGDGNTALRRAMTVALSGHGLRLTDDPDKAVFNVGANVSIGTPDDGMQAVRILWTVNGVDDEKLGTADQANAVPAGSLDGRWGQTAAFVAAAATDGIVGIIEKHDPTKLRAPNLGGGPSSAQPPAPPRRKLRQIPGRAPPPPS